jgi:predicted MPP superfamily phosphohydrolase
MYGHAKWSISRRDFLKAAVAGSVGLSAALAHGAETTLRFGLVTDLHYADVDPLGTRHYRESLDKLSECIAEMNKQNVAFLCQLGDFKDEDRNNRDENRKLEFLRTAEKEFATFNGPRYYVMGNHDLDSISKAQFLANTKMPAANYSFDAHGHHFVVLDANYTSDGEHYDHGNFNWQDTNIPQSELAWLAEDLKQTELPIIVFAHQRLDGEGALFVNNAAEVRAILESAGNVLAVF